MGINSAEERLSSHVLNAHLHTRDSRAHSQFILGSEKIIPMVGKIGSWRVLLELKCRIKRATVFKAGVCVCVVLKLHRKA